MTQRIEPSVDTNEKQSFLSSFFGGNKSTVRPVAAILGAFHSIVDELNTAIEHHKVQREAHVDEIKAIQAKHDVCVQEQASAEAAVQNITALITPKAE